jgi:hypothetical protein
MTTIWWYLEASSSDPSFCGGRRDVAVSLEDNVYVTLQRLKNIGKIPALADDATRHSASLNALAKVSIYFMSIGGKLSGVLSARIARSAREDVCIPLLPKENFIMLFSCFLPHI